MDALTFIYISIFQTLGGTVSPEVICETAILFQCFSSETANFWCKEKCEGKFLAGYFLNILITAQNEYILQLRQLRLELLTAFESVSTPN